MLEVESQGRTNMSPFAKAIYEQKYSFDGTETWDDTAYRVTLNVMGALGYGPDTLEFQRICKFIQERKFLPGGRYLYAAGRDLHQVQNCLLLRAEDSREGWADLLSKSAMALQTGAGIGIDYSDVRPSGSPIKRTGGTASGPLSLMNMVNEIGRGIMQGGSRRSAIWAGLNWSHPDAISFIRCKDWSPELRNLKQSDFTFPAPMELTNISILLDDDFFVAYEDADDILHEHAVAVYSLVVKRMLKTAEPGLSIDIGHNSGETLRNACTEITSRDDSDICNLGSINLSRIEDINEFSQVVTSSTLFLLAGTVYSHVPYEKVDHIRTKNRRLGLGLMGVHDWLLQRGYSYEPNDELAQWLEIYSTSTDLARKYAHLHNLTPPVKTRAIAPTGTIGIIGETTTGIEPIFCVAYKRRYLVGDKDWRYQYVVDPTAQRLIETHGVDPNDIEDAYTLSLNVERRIAFQAWVQGYVDHAISSTINLPAGDSYPVEYFKDILYKYLPQLRGVTVYPDGARGGQPLSPAPYETAIANSGVVFEESEERCAGGLCGV